MLEGIAIAFLVIEGLGFLSFFAGWIIEEVCWKSFKSSFPGETIVTIGLVLVVLGLVGAMACYVIHFFVR